jgi:hypothetical protein
MAASTTGLGVLPWARVAGFAPGTSASHALLHFQKSLHMRRVCSQGICADRR